MPILSNGFLNNIITDRYGEYVVKAFIENYEN
jgi:hypothetical protein